MPRTEDKYGRFFVHLHPGMKRISRILTASAMAVALAVMPMDEVRAQNAGQKGVIMEYYVENGDTVYFDTLPPVWCMPKGTRRQEKDWRKYYKLVYNFNRVYPYALMGKRLVAQVDAEIKTKGLKGAKEDQYINQWQKQLLKDFEPIIRRMTISEGQLLCRLVDREVGRTSYKIVKDYKNGVSATFWQGIARLFGQNLKTPYDPKGQDKETEELVQKWEQGEFDRLYYSIFMEWPVPTEIPSKYR